MAPRISISEESRWWWFLACLIKKLAKSEGNLKRNESQQTIIQIKNDILCLVDLASILNGLRYEVMRVKWSHLISQTDSIIRIMKPCAFTEAYWKLNCMILWNLKLELLPSNVAIQLVPTRTPSSARVSNNLLQEISSGISSTSKMAHSSNVIKFEHLLLKTKQHPSLFFKFTLITCYVCIIAKAPHWFRFLCFKRKVLNCRI